jgi:hypothetical protein
MTLPCVHLSARPSESLVASLCREAHQLRCRAQQVVADLGRCRQEGLVRRLSQELQLLHHRREQLLASARQMRCSGGLRDGLAVAFLEELTSRPLAS